MSNIIIAGVGGQGTLLASRILGAVAIKEGYDVKVSEVHGMSQRGGSVITFVKYGKKVYSPIIDLGEADIILAFEELEALRWISYLKPNGKFIINTQKMDPMPVITGAAKYPENIIDKINEKCNNTLTIDALKYATEIGNVKVANVVLIGHMAKNTDIKKDVWVEAIKETVPAKFVELNIKAFEAGYNH